MDGVLSLETLSGDSDRDPCWGQLLQCCASITHSPLVVMYGLNVCQSYVAWICSLNYEIAGFLGNARNPQKMTQLRNFFSMTKRTSSPNLQHHQKWYPRALRWWNLVLATTICWALIAILQFFLTKSQNEGGIIFAPKVNDLPLRQSFVFLYLPTVIAVLFSIYIVWIDIDAKRYEPYY